LHSNENLNSLATAKWWRKKPGDKNPPPPVDVPRDQVIAFALYTQDRGLLKLTAQLHPLKPDEPREARLELKRGEEWVEAAKVPVHFPGWSAPEEIRRARAEHLCGDQHLAVMLKHGISEWDDGPYAYTSPVPASPLPWTGAFKDGLGNKVSPPAHWCQKKDKVPTSQQCLMNFHIRRFPDSLKNIE